MSKEKKESEGMMITEARTPKGNYEAYVN